MDVSEDSAACYEQRRAEAQMPKGVAQVLQGSATHVVGGGRNAQRCHLACSVCRVVGTCSDYLWTTREYTEAWQPPGRGAAYRQVGHRWNLSLPVVRDWVEVTSVRGSQAAISLHTAVSTRLRHGTEIMLHATKMARWSRQRELFGAVKGTRPLPVCRGTSDGQ